MSKKEPMISKTVWFLLILLCIGIAILIVSRLVAGFDEGVNTMVVQPLIAGLITVHTTIVTHPLFVAHQYLWGVISMFAVGAVVLIVVWPKVRSKVPAKPLAGLQEKVRSSTPQTIPTAPVKQTIPPPAKAAEPKTEEVKPET